MYCPMPSQGMTCGIDNPNIVAPEDQQEDWSIEHWVDPEQCLQTCLERDYCKAYRITGNAVDGWYCENFGLGLGVNGSNVISASAGTVWWDRNCQVHLPVSCHLCTGMELDIDDSTDWVHVQRPSTSDSHRRCSNRTVNLPDYSGLSANTIASSRRRSSAVARHNCSSDPPSSQRHQETRHAHPFLPRRIRIRLLRPLSRSSLFMLHLVRLTSPNFHRHNHEDRVDGINCKSYSTSVLVLMGLS